MQGIADHFPPVSIVGGGVIGLTTAVILAERGHRVEVTAAAYGEGTASYAAAALIGPAVPVFGEQVTAWTETGMAAFSALARGQAPGVRMQTGRLVSSMTEEPPDWAARVPGFRPCGRDEAAGYPTAFWAELPVVDMPPYLQYLRHRVQAAGGTLRTGEVTDLTSHSLSGSVVVNCAGAGARALAEDPDVSAVQGLSVMVPNPGLDSFFYEAGPGDWVSWFCHGDLLSLGGVARTEAIADQAAAAAEIIARCAAVEPRLASLQQREVRAGARPVRPVPRLEWDTSGPVPVLHHYGHGSVGVTVSWGASYDAAELVGRLLR
ncbi:FAD-dependent oxidoreductase [Arthrobacter sp. NPDC055585]